MKDTQRQPLVVACKGIHAFRHGEQPLWFYNNVGQLLYQNLTPTVCYFLVENSLAFLYGFSTSKHTTTSLTALEVVWVTIQFKQCACYSKVEQAGSLTTFIPPFTLQLTVPLISQWCLETSSYICMTSLCRGKIITKEVVVHEAKTAL